jgi:hypothetical protein
MLSVATENVGNIETIKNQEAAKQAKYNALVAYEKNMVDIADY